MRTAERWANKFNDTPIAFIHKTRDQNRPNQVVAKAVVGEVAGRTCIVVDDMIDTGGTIAKAAQEVLEAGARKVIIAATHGVLSDPAAERLGRLWRRRGGTDQHPADSAGAPVRATDGALHRAHGGPGHPRGVRGRLGHVPVRRLSLVDV